MATDALTITDLQLRLDGAPVLRGLSLDVEPGERLALIGNNGTGKSSLLRCLSGEWQADAGAIHWHGRPLSAYAQGDRAQWLGMLPQGSMLNFGFRVHEVIGLGRYPHRSGYRRDREIVLEAAADCDVTHLLDQPYTHCSGGEQQRVHLARVLAQIWEPIPDRPRLLLLDEPVSGLDLAHQHRLFGTLRRLSNAGVTLVFVVHDLNLAARYATRIAILSDGVTARAGAPEQVLTSDTIARYFNWPVTVMRHPTAGVPVLVPSRAEDAPPPEFDQTRER